MRVLHTVDLISVVGKQWFMSLLRAVDWIVPGRLQA